MSIALKPISPAAVPHALEKAERYRLLNEPAQAESICRDVLAVDPRNQAALVTLVLALADVLDPQSSDGIRSADAVVAQLDDGYQRAYYAGILRERWARALVTHGDAGGQALGWLHDALRCYEEAAALPHAAGNEEANLRFNACVRLLEREKLASPEPLQDPGD